MNGGFENGRSPWLESSTGGYEIIDPTNPHTGSYSAYLCGYRRCNDQIWQSVTLPATVNKVTLAFWYYSDTQKSGNTCYDHFYSRIRSSTGATLTTPMWACNAAATNGWVSKTFDVTAAVKGFAGKTIQVYFQGTTNTSYYPSDFFVDDVTLTAS